MTRTVTQTCQTCGGKKIEADPKPGNPYNTKPCTGCGGSGEETVIVK